MFIPAYLSLSRHNIYNFRWPLPPRITVSRSYVYLSLGTREPKEALRLARGLSNLGELLSSHSLRTDLMTHVELKNMVQEYFSEYLKRFKQRIDDTGPLSEAKMRLYQSSLEVTNTAISETDYSWFPEMETRLGKMLDDKHSADSLNDEEHRRLKSLYLQGHKEYFERALNYSLDASNLVIECQPSSVKNIPKQIDAYQTLQQLIDNYLKEQSRSGTGWNRATLAERTAQLCVLVETLGADFNIAELTPTIAITVKTALLKRPRNLNKKKALDRPETLIEGSDLLSNKTVNNYLTCYGGFATWAKNHDFTQAADPFSPIKLKRVKNEKKKYPFSKSDMDKIFSGLSRLRDTNSIEDHHYWVGLIAAYTGARLNEISSLYKTNISQIEGIWTFQIDDELEDKAVKTEASVRKVPIHSQLMKMGFLDFYNDCQHERLFPKLPHHWKSGYGKNVGRWWNEKFLVDIGVKAKEKTFHCFRHTVSSQLQFSDVQEPLIQAIVGHEQKNVLQKHYTLGAFELTQLHEAIEKLNYATS